MITKELIQKHIRRLVEATVKSHTRTSKKGKPFTVKQHDRDISDAAQKAGFNQNTVTKFNRLMNRNANYLKDEMDSLKKPEITADEKEDAREMISMYRQDMRDFQRVYNLVKKGKFNRADDVLDMMDTSARDDIWLVVGGIIRRSQRNRS